MALEVQSAKVTLPIYTRVGDGEFILLGETEIEVPITLTAEIGESVQEAFSKGAIEKGLDLLEPRETLTGAALPDLPDSAYAEDSVPLPDPSSLTGDHHPDCGVIPHQHGSQCHPRCPTCHPPVQKHVHAGPVDSPSIPTGPVPSAGDSQSTEVAGE